MRTSLIKQSPLIYALRISRHRYLHTRNDEIKREMAGAPLSYAGDVHKNPPHTSPAFRLSMDVFYDDEAQGIIAREYIDASNFRRASKTVRDLCNEGNVKALNAITPEHLKKLFRGLADDILIKPKEYGWITRLVSLRVENLSIDDRLIILKRHICAGALMNLKAELVKMLEKGQLLGDDAVLDLFYLAYENKDVAAIEIIIQYGYSVDRSPVVKIINRKRRKLHPALFSHFLEFVRSSGSHTQDKNYLKYAFFLSNLVDKSDYESARSLTSLLFWVTYTHYIYKSGDISEENAYLLSECQRRLCYLLFCSDESGVGTDVEGKIDKYIDRLEAEPDLYNVDKFGTMKVLSAFLYYCKKGDEMLSEKVFSLMTKEYSMILRNLEFIVSLLYYSDLPKGSRARIAEKLVMTAGSLVCQENVITSLSNIAVMAKSDGLLNDLFSAVYSSEEVGSYASLCLESSAIRMKRLDILRKFSKNNIRTGIYALIDDLHSKLETAVLVLREINGAHFDDHVRSILTWPKIYENFKYIFTALAKSKDYDKAIRVLSLVSSRYPAITEEIRLRLILDVASKANIFLDDAIDVVLLTVKDDSKGIKSSLSVINKFIEDIISGELTTRRIEAIERLSAYAIAGCSSKFIEKVPLITDKLALECHHDVSLKIFSSVIESNFMHDTANFNTIHESYRRLADHLLKKCDFNGLKTLFVCVSKSSDIINVKVYGERFHLPAAICFSIEDTIKQHNSVTRSIKPQLTNAAGDFLELFYNTLKSRPSLKGLILEPINKMMEISKMRSSYSDGSILGEEFDESMDNFMASLRAGDTESCSVEAHKCANILLADENRSIISKNPAVLDLYATKALVSYMVNTYINESDFYSLMKIFGSKFVSSMRLSANDMKIVIDLLLKYGNYLFAFSVIEDCLLLTPGDQSTIDIPTITRFVDSCILEDRLYLAHRIFKMKTLADHINTLSVPFLEIFLKFSLTHHNFGDACIILKTLHDVLCSYLRDNVWGGSHCVEKDQRLATEVYAEGKHDQKKALNQDDYSLSITPQSENSSGALSTSISVVRKTSEYVVSISTIIYTLRMALLCDQLEIIKIFMLYIYRASMFISESAFIEIARTFTLSHHNRLAKITLQIMSDVGINVPDTIIVKVINSLIDDDDLYAAWQLFCSCCIMDKNKTISDIIIKKLLINIYAEAREKNSRCYRKIREDIEAFNNNEHFEITLNILKAINELHKSFSMENIEHKGNLPCYYPVKPPSTSRLELDNSDVVRRSNYIKISPTDLNLNNDDSADKKSLRLYGMLIKFKVYEGYKLLSAYIALMRNVYSQCVGNQRFSDILVFFVKSGDKSSLISIAKAMKYLDLEKRLWFLDSLLPFIDNRCSNYMWVADIASWFCHISTTDMSPIIVEYYIKIYSNAPSLRYILRHLLKRRLILSEALLYRLYIFQKYRNQFFPADAKVFRRLVMILMKSGHPLTYRSLEVALYMCEKSSDPENAKSYWKAIVGGMSVNPTLKCYDILMEVLSKCGKEKEAVGVLFNLIKNNQIPLERYNKTHLYVLINAGLSLEALELATTICHNWRKHGSYTPGPIDAPVMTSLMHSLAKSRYYLGTSDAKSLTYVLRMNMDLVKPLWSSLINKLIDEDDFDTMDIIFSSIGERALSVWGMNTLLRIFLEYTKRGILKKAELIYVHLKTYLLHKAIPSGVIEQAIEILCDINACNETVYYMRRLFNILSKVLGVIPQKKLIERMIHRHLEIYSVEYAEFYLGILDEMNMGVSLDICSSVMFCWINIGIYSRALILGSMLISKGFKFNSKLIFCYVWTYLNMKNKGKVLKLFNYIEDRGYVFDKKILLERLVADAYEKKTSEDAFKTWDSLVKFSGDGYIFMNSYIDVSLSNYRLIEPGALSYPSVKSTGVHLSPRIVTNKHLWGLKGSDTAMATGLLPPDFVSGENSGLFIKELYEAPKRRPRMNKLS